MLKRFLLKFSFIFLFALGIAHASEVIYPVLPSDGNFIIDQTNTLKPAQIKEINNIALNLWVDKKIPIVTVMITSLRSMGAANQSIERYTQELFNHWQLGKKKRNYGVILLISKQDRKARIEFGRDWDHRYDSDARDIMADYLVPQFKQGQYSVGVIDGVAALNKLVRGLKLPKIKQPWWVMPITIGIVVLLIGVIVSLFRSGRTGWGWALIIGIGLLLWYMMRNAGSGGLSGGGSGGGGGATGSW